MHAQMSQRSWVPGRLLRISCVNRILAAVVSVVVIAGCGGDDAKSSDATTAPTAAASTTTVATEVVNDDPVLIDLNFGGDSFQIGVSTTTFKAGTINFKATNLGDTPHEFGIARGNSYEELPQLANGSIDEEALGDDFLGKTPIVDKVLAPEREISFDLEPGNYVMFCNIVAGPVSHAARGHILSITVVE